MRAWVVEVGEPVPSDPGVPRLMRAGLLSETLARRGHEVTWWTAAFDHSRKAMRAHGRQRVDLGQHGYDLHLLRSIGYSSHVGPRRVVEHIVNAADFRHAARRAPRPDVICAGLPTLELAVACGRLARKWAVPFVVDVRDLWPDVFEAAIPGPLRSLSPLALAPMRAQARSACRAASAVVGVSEPFRDWGLLHAGRARTPLDRAFPPAYRPLVLDEAGRARASTFWGAHGLVGRRVLAFVGSLSEQFDFTALLAVASRWLVERPDVLFVLAGDGPVRPGLQQRTRDLPNVVLPGWVDAEQIAHLLSVSSVGLAPYVPKVNFLDNLTNKVVEYLAYGVPVVSTLGRGITGRLLESTASGASYEVDDERSLATALMSVLEDPLMSSRARATFERSYSVDAVYGEYAALLEQLAAGRPAS